MDIQELEVQISIMLRHFFLSFKTASFMRGASIQLIVEDFGLVICCIDRLDYKQVDDHANTEYKGWRKVFVSTTDDLTEKRYEILWALMRGGYMRWLRSAHPRQIKNVLVGADNLGRKIIEERLRIWNGKPKFSFWIADNEFVLANGILSELARDPGFFDHMPEIE